MDKKAVIFDLDGTLLNTLEDLTASTNFALENLGFPKRSMDEIRNFVGNGVNKLIERAIPNGLNNPEYIKCVELFKNTYKQNMYCKTKPYKGIIEMLTQLKQHNIKIAVVSNKFDMAVKKLCSKYFPNLIDFAAGENELQGINKKPAPDTVLKVLKEFNIEAGDAIYVGDSEVDIQTAQNANMDCISVTWGFKDEKFLISNGANIIVNAPNQILNAIL